MPRTTVDSFFRSSIRARAAIVPDKRPRARVRVLHRVGGRAPCAVHARVSPTFRPASLSLSLPPSRSPSHFSPSPLFLQIYLDEARH